LRLCGWAGASSHSSTGAKQTSVPSIRAHHSSRVLALNPSASRFFGIGQSCGSRWAWEAGSSMPHNWISMP
jgi:hypothetical protein